MFTPCLQLVSTNDASQWPASAIVEAVKVTIGNTPTKRSRDGYDRDHLSRCSLRGGKGALPLRDRASTSFF